MRKPLIAQGRRLERLAQSLERIQHDLAAACSAAAPRLASLPLRVRASARNLVQYQALRRHDLRSLQTTLSEYGLSSLGRAEAHVEASVASLQRAVQALLGHPATALPRARLSYASGRARLAANAHALLGAAVPGRESRIMVTLPSAAATDPKLVGRLLDAGMDLARINCAHDDTAAWQAMIRHIRAQARRRKRTCRVLMDLAGPKVRTGALEPGEQVVKWKPLRDHHGRVRQPARVAFMSAHTTTDVVTGLSPIIAAPLNCTAVVPVTNHFARLARRGDVIACVDARGKRRRLHVVDVVPGGVVAEAAETAYVEPGTRLRLRRAGSTIAAVRLGALPPLEQHLLLAVDDMLLVTDGTRPGRPARRDAHGHVIEPASIPCQPPEILSDIRVGERIWFDDGRIGGVVRSVASGKLTVVINRATAGGAKLRAEKGINLPDSSLSLPCLSAKDRADVVIARRCADLVGLSFVRHASDVEALQVVLGRGRRRPGIVLKIETPQAFADLPDILVAALAAAPAGIMVARGDLAVEVGFARLAEVQEEILWLGEAAHLPVIWGTQVLESLAKKGLVSRPEVTDAAMSGRAECVMLNKGPNVVEAVAFLSDVLQRMGDHQDKKTNLLRRLAVSLAPIAGPSPALTRRTRISKNERATAPALTRAKK